MSYYMGDAYRGDYYAGDPGIGSFFKKLIGIGTSFIPGIGGVASKVISAIPGGKAATKAMGVVAKGVSAHPVLSAAGAAGAAAAMGAEAAHMMGPGMVGGTKGYHLSKPRKGHPAHLVRNRHMHATNPKALRRALRRVGGFSRLARRVMRLTHPHTRGRYAFKFPKRRKRA